jgi:hypothetical protein
MASNQLIPPNNSTPRTCLRCGTELNVHRQIHINTQFCSKCYNTSPHITGPCYGGCGKQYTSNLNRQIFGHICDSCGAIRKQKNIEQKIQHNIELEEKRRLTEARRKEWALREAEEEAKRKDEKRREEEKHYSAAIDSVESLDQRSLCRMIYDMSVMMQEMREKIEVMEETIDNYETDLKKVRNTANQCFASLDSHNILKTTTPNTSDESDY